MRWCLARITGPVILGVLLLVAPTYPAAAPARLTTAGLTFVAARSHSATLGHMPSVRRKIEVPASSNTYSYSVDLSLDPDPGGLEPEPEPEPDFAVLHGPFVHASRAKDVGVNFPCTASIWDDEGYFNDFTIWLHLLDPNGNEMSPTPNPQWTSTKPSLTTSNTWTRSDPAEGAYTCKADLWVYGTYLGSPTNQKTISYPVPTGETTFGNAWSGISGFATAYKWRATVSNGPFSFTGRTTTEASGGNGNDTCWFSGSAIPPQTSVTGGSWTVDGSNQYGDDIVGWSESAVSYYRSQSRAPCQTEFDQSMSINRPGNSDAQYKTNRLKFGFTATSVWSERDGHSESKSY